MKVSHFLPLILALFFFGCSQDEALFLTPETSSSAADNAAERFAKSTEPRAEQDFEVFFAQTHVLRPTDPYFGLVSNRPALVKAHLTSETGARAPAETVVALTLNGKTREFDLEGPTILPLPKDLSPGKVVHSADDSYTFTIPKEWVQPGLEVIIQAGDQQVQFNDLLIGAPNLLPVTMLDVHFFNQSSGDYPSGWEKDMEAKLPVSAIDLRRIPNVVFPEISIAARHNYAKAARVSSPQEYEELTGRSFDHEQATASSWNRALNLAGGFVQERSIFVGNLYNVKTDGQGSRFSMVSNIHKPGVFFHEFGHAIDLWHWSKSGWDSVYPYTKSMHGIATPQQTNGRHAGPTWRYDLDTKDFISPLINDGGQLRYKRDPMVGGGQVDLAPGHLFTHYSDYSLDRSRKFLENKLAVWNEATGTYTRWNQTMSGYTKRVKHDNGVNYPQEPETDVISVMASASHATPQANIIYPPIGPYKGGFIKLFDAESTADRNLADKIYCTNKRCDVSVRVKQANKETKTYILPMRVDSSIEATKWNSLLTRAINLRASDGEVTKIELLNTPRVEEIGLPANPEVLYVWENN